MEETYKPLPEQDYSLADLNLMDSMEKVTSVLGDLTFTDSYVNEISGYTVNIYRTQGVILEIALYPVEEQIVYHLWSVEVLTSEYSTSRGIRTGDYVYEVSEQYGEPSYKGTIPDKETGYDYMYWYYEDMENKRNLVFKIDNEQIISIMTCMILD
ncbi:MAG: hypothetical protein ABRQ39_21765 [Candidatus Eremiobacterota bacterium]